MWSRPRRRRFHSKMEFQKIAKTSFHRWIEVVMYKYNQKSRIQFQQYLSYIMASILLVKETRVPEENNIPVAIHWQTLSLNVVHLTLIVIRTHNLKLDSAFLIVFIHYYFNPAMKWCFRYFLELHFWMKALPSWSWSHGSWIYNYLCNQCLSPLTLWVLTPLRRDTLVTTLCDKVCQWLAIGRWFSPATPFSSTNKLTVTI
jgi:hypothetical protein